MSTPAELMARVDEYVKSKVEPDGGKYIGVSGFEMRNTPGEALLLLYTVEFEDDNGRAEATVIMNTEDDLIVMGMKRYLEYTGVGNKKRLCKKYGLTYDPSIHQ